jgi:hypothetical protein
MTESVWNWRGRPSILAQEEPATPARKFCKSSVDLSNATPEERAEYLRRYWRDYRERRRADGRTMRTEAKNRADRERIAQIRLTQPGYGH